MPTDADVVASPGLYGVMAAFDDAEPLLEAAHRAYAAGYRRMDAYSPLPVEGLAEAVGFRSNQVSLLVLIAGCCGAAGGFLLMWWISVIAYPHIVAGRPLNSWPAYIPITFECMVLAAAITAVVGMLALNGFPEPYHPLFNVPMFERATRDRFFLCIQADDPKFDAVETRRFLEELNPLEVVDVTP
jgi:hypothetical protein